MTRNFHYVTETVIRVVIIGSFAMLLYGAARSPGDRRPHLPGIFRSKTPPSADALSEFRQKFAQGRWIGRPRRELAELLGSPYIDRLSCEGSSECAWLLRKIDDDAGDPDGVVVEVLYTDSGGFPENRSGPVLFTPSGEPAIHRVSFEQFHYRK